MPAAIEIDLSETNRKLASLDALGRIAWGLEVFGDKIVLSSSFGIQAAVMLHLSTQVRPDIPVVFIDTGYLFPETYSFSETLKNRLGLNLKVYSSQMSTTRQEALYGKRWEMGAKELAEYNRDNKVEPMNRALQELDTHAWLSGLRREQSSTRENLDYLNLQSRTYKLHPILDWTSRDVYAYLTKHDLPYHPLWEKGYVSVGDWHSSSPLQPGMREEDTRFGGIKRECGLHEMSGQADWQI